VSRSSRRTAFLSLIVLAALAALPTTAAASGSYQVKRLRPISGPTPFAVGCPGAFHDADKIDGLVIEPAIAVNPANPRNIIATWKQDVSPEFNGRDDLVASSLDGGKSWRRTSIPGLTRCTGGTSDTASDPWVSFGGDGTAYFGGQFGATAPDPPEIAIGASRSKDGGRHWSAPATISPRLPGNETPAVTGSPTLRGHAYMVWAKFFKVIPAPMEYTLSFSRTTDGGTTWSAPVVLSRPGMFGIDFAPRLRVLPNGTLLVVFARVDGISGLAELRVLRSLDEGQTWLPPVVAGSIPIPPPEVILPETGEQLPQPGYPTSAVAPDGTAYIAFEHSTSPDSGAVGVLVSRDSGATWKSSTLPGVPAFAWEPAMAVDGHNTVGVIWYDLRNDRPGDAVTSADVWFAQSDDHGASWRQTHVAGPTNLRTAAPPAQNRFGEYQGLAGLKRGFAASFGLSAPQARNGPTDIFFARIVPVNRRCDDDDNRGHDERKSHDDHEDDC
jgi:hypothetical protein